MRNDTTKTSDDVFFDSIHSWNPALLLFETALLVFHGGCGRILALKKIIRPVAVCTIFISSGLAMLGFLSTNSTDSPLPFEVISDRYFYAFYGDGGYNSKNNTLWCSVPALQNNTGQTTYLNKKFLYGTFEWDGLFIADGYGWSLAGLSDLRAETYICFEKHVDGFRCILYNLTSPYLVWHEVKDHVTTRYLPDTFSSEWCHYRIVWEHSSVRYFINNELFVTLTENVPTIPLYFHVQTCNSDSYQASSDPLFCFARNIKITETNYTV